MTKKNIYRIYLGTIHYIGRLYYYNSFYDRRNVHLRRAYYFLNRLQHAIPYPIHLVGIQQPCAHY